MKYKKTEHSIQSAIFEYLAYSGHKVWRVNTGAMKIGERFIRFGQAGQGDLFSLKNGKFYSWEIKRPGGKVSDLQQVWMEDIKNHGGNAYIVKSLDEVIHHLRLVGQG